MQLNLSEYGKQYITLILTSWNSVRLNASGGSLDSLLPHQISFVYANEADLLNVALFGKTAGDWRYENPELNGNMRDYASVEQLLVLANLESYNAILIEQNMPKIERIVILNKTAQKQLETILSAKIQTQKYLGLPKNED